MADSSISKGNEIERLADDVVLIVGGGPVGLMVAVVLAHYGIKSVLLERNLTTTKYSTYLHTKVIQAKIP